jgi:uncharacterized membrane protein YcaP (DUF421 family)
MDTILRGIAIYVVVFIVFRVAGRRTLSEITTFDLVLLLIISEATQEAMVDDDHSFMNSALLVITLVVVDILVSLVKNRSKRVDRILENSPMLLMWDGRLIKERLLKERVDEDDILHAARQQHGLERLDQVRHAVLEAGGGITVIPKSP